MSVIFIVFISIAVNLDNFIIGVNLGARHQRLSIISNSIIAGVTGICTFVASFIAHKITGNVLSFTNIIGAFIMIAYGIYCFFQCFRKEDESKTEYSVVSYKDTFILGVILAINCIPPSFSAGIRNLSPVLMSCMATLFSFLCMYISNRFGEKLIQNKHLQLLCPISAVLLIIIGIFELIF